MAPSLFARDFSFYLPHELIAQTPRRRGASRLLVLPGNSALPPEHTRIRRLPDFLSPGDCLVVNDSKVIPARLRAQKNSTGAQIELMLHRETAPGLWQALARPYRRLQTHTVLKVGDGEVRVSELQGAGRVILDFGSPSAARRLLNRFGEPPLPPYIRRGPDTDWKTDRRRYQTIFAGPAGSVAAPTAGLHFSEKLIQTLALQGVRVLTVTLHVGWGTFLPLPEGDVSSLELHAERYEIPGETAAAIHACHAAGKRVVACGTTATRALESAALGPGQVRSGTGETRIFIRPGYDWKIVGGLLTNFHLPESSLLMLACAWGGTARVMDAYAEAVRRKYRFYSYGDAMLLL